MDENLLAEELESLYVYSEFHFSEEQEMFGLYLSAKETVLHETDHHNLLADMRVVINKIKEGVYRVESLGDYLNYWFLNHLQKFDRPAFEASLGGNDIKKSSCRSD